MKILLNDRLDPRHQEQILAVSDDVELVVPESKEEALEGMPEIEVVFGGLNRDLFRRAERLRWVQTWGAGVDGMLTPEFANSEIILTSAKGTVGVHLAEHAMALLLGLTRGIAWAVRKPSWDQRMPIRMASWELIDRTMGIVGLGGTGRDLAVRAGAFGMKIMAVDPEDVDLPDAVDSCWKMDRFHDLLEVSDVVAICCPRTPETEGMFDREAFRRMQKHALLINVTRGKIVDEASLLEALEAGEIAGAGLDVVPQEPLPEDHPLWKMENVIITPHTAGGSPNRQDRIVGLFCDNLKRLMAGEPLLSVIDKQKGY
ncbi:MAG: D-2-hydroxyacid dehydrogenase [bacterium]|nr:D-2-hydroxyacid dehydrogenase [bacterium]